MKRERGGMCSDMSDSLWSYGLESSRLRKIQNILSEPPTSWTCWNLSAEYFWFSWSPDEETLQRFKITWTNSLGRKRIMCLNSGNQSGSLVDVCWLLQMKGSGRGFSFNFWGWSYKNYYLKLIKTCPWLMNCTPLNSLKGWLIKKLPKKRNECCPACVCMVFRRRAHCSLSGSH